MKYRVKFDRIGRSGPPRADLVCDNVTSSDDLAEQVYFHAKKFLASKSFLVTADLEEMTGSIGPGFGRFTIEEEAG